MKLKNILIILVLILLIYLVVDSCKVTEEPKSEVELAEEGIGDDLSEIDDLEEDLDMSELDEIDALIEELDSES